MIEKLKSAADTTEETTDNNDFEIIETTNNTNTSRKIRPNDKVNVRYVDGKMEFDVKYKKVMEDIKAGKCQII